MPSKTGIAVIAVALKADALDEVAYNLLTTSGRDYLHTYAQELRESIDAAVS